MGLLKSIICHTMTFTLLMFFLFFFQLCPTTVGRPAGCVALSRGGKLNMKEAVSVSFRGFSKMVVKDVPYNPMLVHLPTGTGISTSD